MNQPVVKNYLTIGAIVGNVLFILWVTDNGINEGFTGTPVQLVSYLGLVALLTLNIVLIYQSRGK